MCTATTQRKSFGHFIQSVSKWDKANLFRFERREKKKQRPLRKVRDYLVINGATTSDKLRPIDSNGNVYSDGELLMDFVGFAG